MEAILKHLPENGQDFVLGGDFNSPSHLDATGKERMANVLPSHLLARDGWIDMQANQTWVADTWMKSQCQYCIDRLDRIYVRGARIEFSEYGGIEDADSLGLIKWPTGQDHRLVWQDVRVTTQ
jgi:endonuclease/exonuclease/phosphatase family metal-dependent hydrolase